MSSIRIILWIEMYLLLKFRWARTFGPSDIIFIPKSLSSLVSISKIDKDRGTPIPIVCNMFTDR